MAAPGGRLAGAGPSLLLFYHIHRTGGTTLKAWLSQNSAAAPRGLAERLDWVIPYHSAKCWMKLYPDVFKTRRRACRVDSYVYGNACNGASASRHTACAPRDAASLDWRRLRLAVEFHEHSMPRFWGGVVPYLPALRAAYAAINGTVQTATILREPLAHAISLFRYRPPYRRSVDSPLRCNRGACGRGALAYSFAEWIATTPGLQAGWLATRGRFNTATVSTARDGFRNSAGCDVALAQAVDRLRAFDVVGLTPCLPALFRALERRLRWAPVDSKNQRRRRMRAGGRGKPLAISQAPAAS